MYVYSATYRKDGAGLTETFPAAGGMPSEQLTYYFAATGQNTTTSAQDLPGGPTRTYASTSYDTSGRVWTRVLGDPNGTPSNNVLRTYGYDARGRLFSLTATARVGSSVQSTVQSDTYEFDVNGNIAARKDAVAGQAECFGYDTRNRLNRAYTQTNGACAGSLQDVGPDPYERTYTYDAISRLTSQSKRTGTAQAMTVSSYTYAASAPGGCVAGTQTAKPHAVTAVSGVGTSGYDCAGNMTSRTSPLGAFTQAWNSQGKLEQVTKTGYTALYIYGPNGQRLIQEEGSKRTVYLPGQEITSTGGAAATGARYITAGPDGPQVALRRTGTSAGIYYLGGDAQGSVSWSVSAASLAVTRARYYPYGQVRGTANTMPTDHGFVGQIEDDGTGLNYLNNRYQDPATGVFLSVDPLVSKTGQPYLYTNGNPTTLSDPSGLDPGWAHDTNPCNDAGYYSCTVQKGGRDAGVRVKSGPRQLAERCAQSQYNSGCSVDEVFPVGTGPRTIRFLTDRVNDVIDLDLTRGARAHNYPCFLCQKRDSVVWSADEAMFFGLIYDYYKTDATGDLKPGVRQIIGEGTDAVQIGDGKYVRMDVLGNVFFGFAMHQSGYTEQDALDFSHGTACSGGVCIQKVGSDIGATDASDDLAVSIGWDWCNCGREHPSSGVTMAEAQQMLLSNFDAFLAAGGACIRPEDCSFSG